jgi:acetyltransferase-like isoleucine patch superfamily enzyme
VSRNAPGSRLPSDWHDGIIPANASIDDEAWLETTFSFTRMRSTRPDAVRMGRGTGAYQGTMFDLGPASRVTIGEFAAVVGVWFISDAGIEVGDHCLLSWNVVLMDTYRVPVDRLLRRRLLRRVAGSPGRRFPASAEARPIRIGDNVWIGFDSCVLPGVTIGEGAIVGARSVVTVDVAPRTIVAGNPARPIRWLEAAGRGHG